MTTFVTPAMLAEPFDMSGKTVTVPLQPSSVSTAAIADSAVTLAKVASGAFTADAAGRAKFANGIVTPALLAQPMTAMTAAATTSGTVVDFTGIPAWVRRITAILRGVSTSGTSDYCLRLGTSGGFVSTGYVGSAGTSASFSLNGGTGMILFGATAPIASTVAHAVITIVNISGTAWVYWSQLAFSDAAGMRNAGGSVDIGGTLTQLRLTTIGGTDTFDAGSMNVLYE